MLWQGSKWKQNAGRHKPCMTSLLFSFYTTRWNHAWKTGKMHSFGLATHNNPYLQTDDFWAERYRSSSSSSSTIAYQMLMTDNRTSIIALY